MWQHIRTSPLSFLAVAVFCWASLHDIERRHNWRERNVLNWDIEAYYHYLPATFIHGDPRDLSFVRAIDEVIHPGSDSREYGIEHHPVTGGSYLKYPYGTALFELPGFLIAHASCSSRWSSDPADGYSAPYQLAVQLSTAFAVIIALFVLRHFLLRHCDDRSSAVALLLLAMGTNLYYYSTVATGMSHPYLFLLTAVLLDATDRWHRTPRMASAITIGAVLGVAVITRPTEIALALIPLLWCVFPGEARRQKWEKLRSHQRQLIATFSVALLAVLPQLLYWKATTGFFIFYSYGEEGFDFLRPHVIDGLFGFRKGWFVYSPLVVFGFMGLVLVLRDRRMRGEAIPAAIYFTVAIWVAFSWYQWWYGGSFGCRALIGALPLLALPTAQLAQRIFRSHWIAIAAMLLVLYAGIRLNYFQMEQYMGTIIHWDSMTWDRYWEVFGEDHWERLKPFPR